MGQMHLKLSLNITDKVFIALWLICTNCCTEISKPDVSSTNVALLQYSNILPDQHIVSTQGLLYQNKEMYLFPSLT